jgi:hypothetical protein
VTTWTPSTMGRKGGASTSPAKRKAARENGKKHTGSKSTPGAHGSRQRDRYAFGQRPGPDVLKRAV